MYEDARKYQYLSNLRKERFLRMQTLTRPNYSPTNSNPTDAQALRVAVLAVILFALSGLITGFAFGAFVHFSPARKASTTTNITTVQQKTGNKTPVATQTVQVQALGWPIMTLSSYIEKADNNTPYSVSIQVTDKKKGNTWGNPLPASGITCKLWLVQRIPSKKTLDIPFSILQNTQSLQSPITGQVGGQPYPEISGLSFNPGMPQVQLSKPGGQVTWKYQVSQSIKAGNYDLVALTDWDGKAFNWSWVNIEITDAD
ncbi:MAG TPA: hypothetical protein VKV40_13410 [Ktedonobacteraceae bacterium]|nr:hypothetical protein [Ktedonobacteraceae bacterium]